MNKIKMLVASLMLAALSSTPAVAGLITFEGMPNNYLYSLGGSTNFGNYWAGVNFGPDSTILDAVRGGYNSGGYPPHSGTSVLFSINTPYIDMTIDNPVNDVSFWYSAPYAFNVSTYDASNTLIASIDLPYVYGSSSFVDLPSLSANIARVRWSGTGNYFTIDDVFVNNTDTTGHPRTVPDAASSLSLLGLGLVAVAGLRRKFDRN